MEGGGGGWGWLVRSCPCLLSQLREGLHQGVCQLIFQDHVHGTPVKFQGVGLVFPLSRGFFVMACILALFYEVIYVACQSVKQTNYMTDKQSTLIQCENAMSLLVHLDRERAFPAKRGILEKLGF